VDRVVPRFVGYRPEVDLGRLVPRAIGGGYRFRLSGGTLTRLDETLQVDGSRDVWLPPRARLLTVSDDLGCFVAADEEVLLIVGDEVRVLDVAAADSAVFLDDDRLLVSAPDADVELRQHEVFLVDCASASVVDRVTLDVGASVEALVHPTDGSVVLEAAEGEDGSHIFVVRRLGDRLEVELVGQDMVAADFSPSGSRLLVTPHLSLVDDEVMVFDWPAMTRRDRLTGEQAGRDEDDDIFFHTYGCFLDEDRILLLTNTNGVLLCEDDLKRRTPLDLSAAPQVPEAEVAALYGLSPTTFAVRLWQNRRLVTAVWAIGP